MTYQLHHIHLLCSDLEEMIHFFNEMLGARLVERKKFGTADGATLDLNGTTVNLRVAREDETVMGDNSIPQYGYNHIGLMVEDVDKAHAELTAKGYVFSTAPQNAAQHRIAFFNGPDNITIELMQRL